MQSLQKENLLDPNNLTQYPMRIMKMSKRSIMTIIATAALLISFTPRIFIIRNSQVLIEGTNDVLSGSQFLGLVGLLLLLVIAWNLGRGNIILALIAYTVLQGSMRRLLVIDCGLPRVLMYLDDVAIFVLFLWIIPRWRSLIKSRLNCLIIILLSISLIFAFISTLLNQVPLINSILGFWRSVLSGPIYLLALLNSGVGRKILAQLFLGLNSVLFTVHSGMAIVKAISARTLMPGDAFSGAFGSGGSNMLSLAAGLMMLYFWEFPNRPNEYTGVYVRHNLVWVSAWLFLLVWGASRLAIPLTFAFLAILAILGFLKSLFKMRLHRKYVALTGLAVLFVGGFFFVQQRFRSEFGGILFYESLDVFKKDWPSESATEVQRGRMLEYGLNLFRLRPENLLWGYGPGSFRSTSGLTLHANLAIEAEEYFDGRYLAPIFFVDLGVEYGIIGLGLILAVPLTLLTAILWKRMTQKKLSFYHGWFSAGIAILLLLLASLLSWHTLEYRGVITLVYLMIAVILSS
jgi:hypothetical protein